MFLDCQQKVERRNSAYLPHAMHQPCRWAAPHLLDVNKYSSIFPARPQIVIRNLDQIIQGFFLITSGLSRGFVPRRD
jgi:hypothetical protein